MVHKPNKPKTEQELRNLFDWLYQTVSEEQQNGTFTGFKGLLEIASSEPVIVTAVHNIKNNKGSKTPGVDGETIRKFLDASYEKVISYVNDNFANYKPLPVRRVEIPKPGKEEKRPLSIPVIGDRVIQECIRLVLEPILEAQFYKHSYGFRPMREQQHAIARINFLAQGKGYHWVVEGDISKFFDEVNHNILIKKLWGMGIRDKRILAIIKAMLKAGVVGETKTNEMGTPQGGIISPLLSNVYLHAFDKWIAREWDEKVYYHKHTGKKLPKAQSLNRARNYSKLRPVYLVRYADDWVLLTNSKANAERWKYKAKIFLEKNLKLRLSEEKTKITNIRNRPITFLGFEIGLRENEKGEILTNIGPDRKRLAVKMQEVYRETRKIRKASNVEFAIDQINKVNSTVRGLIEYYKIGNLTSARMQKYAGKIQKTALKAVKRYGGKTVKANETNNLLAVHSNYTTLIPSIKYKGVTVGITYLSFTTREDPQFKKPDETPYSPTGRKTHETRTGKKPLLVRADEILSESYSGLIASGKLRPKYNFEYFMNRAYAFNRDKGKCKICDVPVDKYTVHIHHCSPLLPLSEVNRVSHLATTCNNCHKKIHDKNDCSNLGKKVWEKIQKYRKLLEINTVKTKKINKKRKVA